MKKSGLSLVTSLSVLALATGLLTNPTHAGGLGVFASHMDTSDLSNSVGIGGRLQVDLSNLLSLDFAVAYHDGLEEDIAGIPLELEALPVEIGLALKLPVADTKITPYLGGGVGYYRLDLDDGDPRTDRDLALDDEIGWYAVLGMDLQLNQTFGLFLEGRYRQIEGTLESNEITSRSDSELDLGGISVNLGLQFRW